MSDKTVTIAVDEYKSLLDDEFKLTCLENAGVDNWGGYSDAMEEYHGEEDEG